MCSEPCRKRNIRARSKGENHQDKYTKTTSLKFVFTSSVKKPAGSSSVFARILPLTWLLWKLNFSGKVCHSAKNQDSKPDLKGVY